MGEILGILYMYMGENSPLCLIPHASIFIIFQQSLSNSMGSSSELRVPDLTQSLHISSSNPNLLTHFEAEKTRPVSMPDTWMTNVADPRIQDAKLREDFLTTAKSG